jgi:hypothetical protein
MAGSFRSRTAEGIAFEAGGHLLLYTLVRLRMAEAAAAAAGISPLRLSFAAALGEVKDMGQGLLQASRRHAERALRPRLVELIGAHRVPFRPGRHYPRPDDTKPKAGKHGKEQPPHKVDRTTRRIIMDRGIISRRISQRGQFFPQFLGRQLKEFPEAQVGQFQTHQTVRRLTFAATDPELTQVPVQPLQVE